jgi:hypothetical protein
MFLWRSSFSLSHLTFQPVVLREGLLLLTLMFGISRILAHRSIPLLRTGSPFCSNFSKYYCKPYFKNKRKMFTSYLALETYNCYIWKFIFAPSFIDPELPSPFPVRIAPTNTPAPAYTAYYSASLSHMRTVESNCTGDITRHFNKSIKDKFVS